RSWPGGVAGAGAGAVIAATGRHAGGVGFVAEPAGRPPRAGGDPGRGAGPAAGGLPRGDYPAQPGGTDARGGGPAHAAQLGGGAHAMGAGAGPAAGGAEATGVSIGWQSRPDPRPAGTLMRAEEPDWQGA